MVCRLSGEWHRPPLQDQASKDQQVLALRLGPRRLVGRVKARQEEVPTRARPRPT